MLRNLTVVKDRDVVQTEEDQSFIYTDYVSELTYHSDTISC